jgi:orotate phosphoribosyltransferase
MSTELVPGVVDRPIDPRACTTLPTTPDQLATRLAIAPGLVRPGRSCWDNRRTPIQPLALESAYADPQLFRDLGARGARIACDLDVDVVVGGETAGVPLAATVSLAARLPFAFVRKSGYHGHELTETPVRGAEVAGRRVLLVDDGVWRGVATEHFAAALEQRARTSSVCSALSTCVRSPTR